MDLLLGSPPQSFRSKTASGRNASDKCISPACAGAWPVPCAPAGPIYSVLPPIPRPPGGSTRWFHQVVPPGLLTKPREDLAVAAEGRFKPLNTEPDSAIRCSQRSHACMSNLMAYKNIQRTHTPATHVGSGVMNRTSYPRSNQPLKQIQQHDIHTPNTTPNTCFN